MLVIAKTKLRISKLDQDSVKNGVSHVCIIFIKPNVGFKITLYYPTQN